MLSHSSHKTPRISPSVRVPTCRSYLWVNTHLLPAACSDTNSSAIKISLQVKAFSERLNTVLCCTNSASISLYGWRSYGNILEMQNFRKVDWKRNLVSYSIFKESHILLLLFMSLPIPVSARITLAVHSDRKCQSCLSQVNTVFQQYRRPPCPATSLRREQDTLKLTTASDHHGDSWIIQEFCFAFQILKISKGDGDHIQKNDTTQRIHWFCFFVFLDNIYLFIYNSITRKKASQWGCI